MDPRAPSDAITAAAEIVSNGRTDNIALDLFVPECKLIAGDFAMWLQVFLGGAATATLLYKRFAELEPRPWLIWYFDVSKQAFSGVMQHVAGIAFGIAFASGGAASACSWYLVIFCISTVTSLTWLWFAMEMYTYIVERNGLMLLRTGEYGTPPSWKPWLAQILSYGLIVAVEKVFTAVFIIAPLFPILDKFAAWAEAPFVAYPNVELLLAMVIGPMLLNGFFFWVADNLVAARAPTPADTSSSSNGSPRSATDSDTALCSKDGRGKDGRGAAGRPGDDPAVKRDRASDLEEEAAIKRMQVSRRAVGGGGVGPRMWSVQRSGCCASSRVSPRAVFDNASQLE